MKSVLLVCLYRSLETTVLTWDNMRLSGTATLYSAVLECSAIRNDQSVAATATVQRGEKATHCIGVSAPGCKSDVESLLPLAAGGCSLI